MCLVPVYNALKVDANFYDLVSNVKQLKPINCEVPAGSCAVVAYTLNTWVKNRPAVNAPPAVNVSFNVKWVMVLGAPRRN